MDSFVPLHYKFIDDYLEKFRKERNNPLRFVPATTVRRFPRSGNEWLYGWTYRGTGIINQRDDLELINNKKLENDIHESIHTTDEYETRRLTEWIMDTLFPGDEKYKTKPEEYRR